MKKEMPVSAKRRRILKIIITVLILLFLVGFCVIFIIWTTTYPPRRRFIEYERLPDLSGFDYFEAKEYFAGKFEIRFEAYEYSDEYPDGAIISQIPQEGKEYIIGKTSVDVIVSKGAYISDTVTVDVPPDS